jgi:hypothetical protein
MDDPMSSLFMVLQNTHRKLETSASIIFVEKVGRDFNKLCE